MKFLKILLLLLITSSACNQIENGSDLSNDDLQRIRNLNLLDTNEHIIKFYSNFKNSVAGSFYTDKRMASYWIDEDDSTKNELHFAFYRDIRSIDTVLNTGLTYSPYLLVVRKDNSSFKVYVDGKKEEIRSFFEGADTQWKISNQKLSFEKNPG